MNYPQYGQPAQPQFQQPQYAPQPAAPQAQFQQPQYAPQPQFQGAPQGQQAPAPALARGTLEDFWDQPSTMGGGPNVSKFFNGKQQGHWLDLIVSRDLLHSDTRQQTDINGVPQAYKDGTPKFVLILPVTVNGSSDGSHVQHFTEGSATIWIKSFLKDEFSRAMAAAGIRELKGGTRIIMTSAGERASRPGFSAAKLYAITLYPAEGAAPVTVQAEVPTAAPVAPAAPAAPNPVASAPVAAPTTAPAAPAPASAVLPPAPVAAPVPAPVAGMPAAAPTSNLTEQQASMLARLNGQA